MVDPDRISHPVILLPKIAGKRKFYHSSQVTRHEQVVQAAAEDLLLDFILYRTSNLDRLKSSENATAAATNASHFPLESQDFYQYEH